MFGFTIETTFAPEKKKTLFDHFPLGEWSHMGDLSRDHLAIFTHQEKGSFYEVFKYRKIFRCHSTLPLIDFFTCIIIMYKRCVFAFLVLCHVVVISAQSNCVTPVKDIIDIARTAEQLAVTFYSNGYKNAAQLGLTGSNLAYIAAALEEEQLHESYWASLGGVSMASTFSFPNGSKTFHDLTTFIETQQEIEGYFDSAYLAAVKELSIQNQSSAAQVAAQVAIIEGEHRVLGRVIGNLIPADDRAFSPVLVSSVADAVTVFKNSGYLSPTAGNSYSYSKSNVTEQGVKYLAPTAVPCPTSS